MSSQSPVYHESDYQQGKFKDGAWHCNHGDKTVERTAFTSRSLAYVGLKFWICANRPSCRFYLWEDHLEEAFRYHQVPDDVIEKMTPRKRKRDGDITDYFPITPKTPRTRDAVAQGADSDNDDIYEVSDRAASPSTRHRDSSPTPLPRRSNAPSRSLGPPSPPSSWEEALEEAVIQAESRAVHPPAPPAFPSSTRPYSVLGTLLSAPVIMPSNPTRQTAAQTQMQPPPQPQPQPALGPSDVVATPETAVQVQPRPRTPPPTARVQGNAPAPRSPVFEPRTPRSHGRPGRRPANDNMQPPNPPTPGSGRRRLSAQELETYNVMVKALVGANVKLSVKGQNALRDIVKEEDFWVASA